MWQRAQIQLQLPMCHLFKNPTMPLGRKILLMCLLRQSQVEKNTSSQGAQMPTTVSATWSTTLVCRHQKKKEEQKTVWELHVYMCFELCLKHNWKAINLHRPQNYFYNNNKRTLLVGYSKWHNHGLHRGGMLCLIGTSGGWGNIFFLTCNDLPERHWAARARSQGGVVLWESRTEVSFSIRRKIFVLYVYVIQE